MRPRTKITIPNPGKTEAETFDRFVRIVLAKPKPAKDQNLPNANKPPLRAEIAKPRC